MYQLLLIHTHVKLYISNASSYLPCICTEVSNVAKEQKATLKKNRFIAVTRKVESEVPVYAMQAMKCGDALLLSFLTSALDGRKWLA